MRIILNLAIMEMTTPMIYLSKLGLAATILDYLKKK